MLLTGWGRAIFFHNGLDIWILAGQSTRRRTREVCNYNKSGIIPAPLVAARAVQNASYILTSHELHPGQPEDVVRLGLSRQHQNFFLDIYATS